MGIWVSISKIFTRLLLRSKNVYNSHHLLLVFSVSHFAELYAKKLGIQAGTLRKTLWGDFFLNTKTKRIHKGAQVGSHVECLVALGSLAARQNHAQMTWIQGYLSGRHTHTQLHEEMLILWASHKCLLHA